MIWTNIWSSETKILIHVYYCEIVLQVTLIAQGDVPLSIVMTVCTTLGAVLLTPLLTMFLAGTYVPVDAIKLSLSTLQVNLLFLLILDISASSLSLSCMHSHKHDLLQSTHTQALLVSLLSHRHKRMLVSLYVFMC